MGVVHTTVPREGSVPRIQSAKKQLRKSIADLHWDECADIDGIPTDEVPVVDPTNVVASATSPGSAGSGA